MSVNHHWKPDLFFDGKADGVLYSSVKKEKAEHLCYDVLRLSLA